MGTALRSQQLRDFLRARIALLPTITLKHTIDPAAVHLNIHTASLFASCCCDGKDVHAFEKKKKLKNKKESHSGPNESNRTAVIDVAASGRDRAPCRPGPGQCSDER